MRKRPATEKPQKKASARTLAPAKQAGTGAVSSALRDLLTGVPRSAEPRSAHPRERSQELARSAALRAGAASTALSIPPGPLGMLTVLPDLIAIWHIQRQLVADMYLSGAPHLA